MPPPTGSALTDTGSTTRWLKIRAVVLRRDSHRCQVPTDGDGHTCGRPATVAGHITARADWPPGQPGIDHLENLRAECEQHSSSEGGKIGARRRGELMAAGRAALAAQEAEENFGGPFFGGAGRPSLIPVRPSLLVPAAADLAVMGRDAADAAWDASSWLDEARGVPPDASWPRFMTCPHPAAVGSLGEEFTGWCAARGRTLRWWQRLVASRLLEVDAAGVLVWRKLLLTAPRQVGKSLLLAELALWRMAHAQRFGEEQTVLHTGKDMSVCRELQRAARPWARGAGWKVTEANGKEQIEAPDCSRWLIRAYTAVYGYSVCFGIIDEAWDVPAQVVSVAMLPTMLERLQAQLVIASTAAGDELSSPLFPDMRAAALADLDDPADTLLVEWSARGDADPRDVGAQRAASPHWSGNRAALIASEPDVDAVRSQYLNVWPAALVSSASPPLVFDRALLRRGLGPSGAGRAVLVLEDQLGGQGCCLVVAEEDAAGVLRVTGQTMGSRDEAWSYLTAVAQGAGLGAVRFLVGATLADDPRAVDLAASPRGSRELRPALALFRDLLACGRVVVDEQALVDALVAARTVETATGVTLAFSRGSGERLDLVRAVLWAVMEAAQPAPSIAVA